MADLMDTATFMERNGRDCFYGECDQPQGRGDVVEFSTEITMRRILLKKVAIHCRKQGMTIPEFLAEVLEGWFE